MLEEIGATLSTGALVRRTERIAVARDCVCCDLDIAVQDFAPSACRQYGTPASGGAAIRRRGSIGHRSERNREGILPRFE